MGYKGGNIKKEILNFPKFFTTSYSELSLSRTRKGPGKLFEMKKVRDREKVTKTIITIGTEVPIRDRERFEIEGSRDRESSLYIR